MSPLSLGRVPGVLAGEARFTVMGRTVGPAAFWGPPTLPLALRAGCAHSKSGGLLHGDAGTSQTLSA